MGRTNNISILSATAASTTTTSEDDDGGGGGGGGGGQGFHFQVGKVAQPVGSWSSTSLPSWQCTVQKKTTFTSPFGDSDTR